MTTVEERTRTAPPLVADEAPWFGDEAAQDTTELLERRSRSTSEAERRRLEELVIRRHLPLARRLAGRYRNRGIADDDLVQVACTGLVLAVRRYDPQRGDDFLRFAVPTVHGQLKRHFRDSGWVVRPPRRVQVLQAQIARATQDLAQHLGRFPTPVEVADHLAVSVDDVLESLAARGCFAPTSLDGLMAASDAADGGPLVGMADVDRRLDAVEARVMLAPLLPRLAERDRVVLAMRFFEERTQQEIGDELGLTQIQVSRLLKRIFRILREMLTEERADAAGPASPR